MADKEDTGFDWGSLVGDIKEIGLAGADVYKAWNGGSSEEEIYEKAYLSGQIAAINQQQQREDSSDVVKIGDVELSTSSILLIFGGTLGLLILGIGLKKLF